jgi:hypothetical protein
MNDITSVIGIKVHLGPGHTCRCGWVTGVIGEGKAMHIASLRCSACGRNIRWLKEKFISDLIETIRVFGRPFITFQTPQQEFSFENDAATPGASAAFNSAPHENGEVVMALGFNYGTGGDASDIVPYVKYDARAGRLFRNDRTQVDGAYSNSAIDITSSFKAVLDLEHIEVGYILFAANVAPAYSLVRFGEPLPERPDDGRWKQGLRIMMKLDASCGGDIREIASNASAFLKGFDELHTRYEVERIKNPGKLPVVVLRSTQPITTGIGDRKSTNYQPVLEIVGWVPRPANLVHVPKSSDEDYSP